MSPILAAPTLAQIRSVDWQPQLGAPGAVVDGVDDIDQCIRTILLTPKGSVPHDPDFGSNLHLYLDWPLQAARPQIIRESIDAITRNEPRVSLVRLNVVAANQVDPALQGAIALEVEWSVAQTVGNTMLVIGASA